MITTLVEFLVAYLALSYNIILCRPTLNALKAITSTCHQKMKFATLAGIGEVLETKLLQSNAIICICMNISPPRIRSI